MLYLRLEELLSQALLSPTAFRRFLRQHMYHRHIAPQGHIREDTDTVIHAARTIITAIDDREDTMLHQEDTARLEDTGTTIHITPIICPIPNINMIIKPVLFL